MLNDLLDDLTPNQYQQLLSWLCANMFVVTRANVKRWRKSNGLK